MSPNSHPIESAPAVPELRALNVSLSSLAAGMQPSGKLLDRTGTEYFRFPNGQIRRQIGEGHSRVERDCRRRARLMARLLVLPAETGVVELTRRLVEDYVEKNFSTDAGSK